MMKYRSITAAALTACILTTASGQADIIVDVQDTTITAGGTGTVDVLISSNGLSTDQFDFASYVFGITPVGSPSTTLQFADPQSTTESGLGTYVFAADLAAGGLDFIVNDPAEVEGSDFTDTGSLITLSGTQQLLAQLDLEHLPPGAGLGAGDQFRITLVNTSAFGGSDTEFLDGITPATIDADSFNPLGVGGGLITVTSAAVPEPGTFALSGIAVLAGAVHNRRKKRLVVDEATSL
ncbi:MAG: PEP-CTERM sorting domain-containing protein [Planctomycetaceae bacterium]|nr:PEP-CTERM sorting domain-containing protein [Planctomycetaceae bacterium]